MRIVSVVNTKGGVGKSTIATNLAASFQLAGVGVVLADADPQGSARDWAGARDDQPVRVVALDRPAMLRDVRHLGAELVIIDAPPQAAELAGAAIAAADLVLIPVSPSPYDLWASSQTVELVKQRQALADGRPLARLLISRAITGTRLEAELEDALADMGIPVLASRTHQRVIYPAAASEGRSVAEAEPNGQAAAEIEALRREVQEVMG